MNTLNYVKTKYRVPRKARRFRLKGILRKDLYVLYRELGFTNGCEVGVRQGRNARVILDTIPNLKLHCVDSWQQNEEDRNTRRLKKFYVDTRNVLRKYLRNGQANIVRKWSMDAVKDFKNESLDFVYIDANHRFDYVMRDIIEWSKKVRVGGIVSGHDYYKYPIYGVVTAVNAYTKEHRIKPWFVLDDEVLRKRSQNSWFWVKNE